MQKRLDFGLANTGAPDALEGLFHPAVARWFTARFGQATEVQRQAWAVTAQRRDALIAAPTGSGKTLAAFLSAINDLVVESLEHGLDDAVYVLYVSPLKALSNDIQKNLQAPLEGIRQQLAAMGLPDPGIRDAVRTGDTSAAERALMRRNPPHILVTTPESLYILLTSDSGRDMLRGVRSVIVDELHAVAGSKRGAHLMLTLERLAALTAQPPLRVGLSATQKPIEAMAEFLMGDRGPCAIIDTGHARTRDLALELPNSPLETVMSNEVWSEVYDRLAQLANEHRTTLIFVNQRRLAERAARALAERLGEEHVTAHHGSLAKEHRLKAEQRLKAGELKALVATSALELGIDIGDIDLVCQLGSPRSIAAFLQRVGRAGHAVGAVPKGRLFPLSLDDLLESAALLDSVRRGELDRIIVPQAPLDVLAQQIVAEVGCREWDEDELYALLRRAASYRNLPREDYDQTIRMLADGYATRRGRRGAYLHYDEVNHRLRARRGARLVAVTNAGVIPDQFDYDVILLPEGHRIGTLNEDFSFESVPGDIFQLGNTAYRIHKVETGKVYVEDAKGQPPTLPFWFGEGLGRTDELSAAVSRLSREAGALLAQGEAACAAWLRDTLALPPTAAAQLANYLALSQAALGALPDEHTIILERFFDDVGDAHLVIHSPHGSRLNRAWGLALRKRFCRTFNFELQASALEDSIVLSLGPTHSFPLEDIRHYLKSTSVREVLVQALLDAPMFGTRWRWNATAALAIQRMRNGKRVPPQFQRSDSEDLLTVVFPDQVACAENLSGEREVPDHPLVKQTIADCLNLTMDIDGLERLLARIERGEVQVLARDLTGPSPLAHAILSAKPYAFLDDGAAEERRTLAVSTHRNMELRDAAALGRIDAAAIARVREEAWPAIGSADELHDALLVYGFLTEAELARSDAQRWLHDLQSQKRAASADGLLYAAERLHEALAVQPQLVTDPPLPRLRAQPDADDALRELLRSRLELLGPVTASTLAAPLRVDALRVEHALLQLEAEGGVMRGNFSAAAQGEWCERRLLARIHRYTRERQRAEIQPVAPAQFMRFLLRWQGVAQAGSDERRQGETGLLAVLEQLEGYALPAAAWEDDVLSARLREYAPEMLDRLCAAGHVAWCRPAETGAAPLARKSGPLRTTPILLGPREPLAYWQFGAQPAQMPEPELSARAQKVLAALRLQGASFLDDLTHDAGLLPSEAEDALGELVSQGLVTSDSFAGLRALVMPAARKERLRHRRLPSAAHGAGRWALVRAPRISADDGALAAPHVEHIARALLRRYGVVFRKLLEREDRLPPWRELFYVYRRLEARGEIRGGRFVTGFSGEQFALPDAAAALHKLGAPRDDEWVSLSAADPLNLVGVLLPGERVPALTGNRVLLRNGVPAAVQAGEAVRYLQPVNAQSEWEVRNLLIRKQRAGSYLEPPRGFH